MWAHWLGASAGAGHLWTGPWPSAGGPVASQTGVRQSHWEESGAWVRAEKTESAPQEEVSSGCVTEGEAGLPTHLCELCRAL